MKTKKAAPKVISEAGHEEPKPRFSNNEEWLAFQNSLRERRTRGERMFCLRCKWHAIVKGRYLRRSLEDHQRIYLYGKYLMKYRRAALGTGQRNPKQYDWKTRFLAFYHGRDLICGDVC